MERQRVLSKPERPDLWLIIAEGALRQQVGTSQVMADQIDRLIELSQEPGITLQVLPFTAGAHVAMRLAGFVIMSIAQHGITTVYIEGQNSGMFFTDSEDLAEYGMIFNRLRAACLDEGRPTRTLLERIARDHRRGEG